MIFSMTIILNGEILNPFLLFHYVGGPIQGINNGRNKKHV